jgi:hydroxymethylpyrimidine/phosphomethylpyrimidine kinase
MSRLWLVGGVDPTGGAGVGRDRAVARALAPRLDVEVVITASTEQGDGKPARARPTYPELLDAALAPIADAVAVKVGLVPAVIAENIASALARTRAPRVLDPVLRASDGGDMGATVSGLSRLLPHVDLVTPNRGEALALFGDVHGDALARAAARLGTFAVLAKDVLGGDPRYVTDRLLVDGEIVDFTRVRRAGPDPRGTGCALATAIACGLADGEDMRTAVGRAIAWLDDARTHTIVGPDGKPHLVLRHRQSDGS